MGRPKGGTNKHWTKEEKFKIIQPIINYEKPLRQVSRETEISAGMLSVWVRLYKEGGIERLENKRKPGNPISKYYLTKHFKSREEKLEYEIMKLKIENERLKKGYLVKGDGSIVVFKK